MNPAIAVLREVYPDRPAQDRDWAGYAVADADGTYRYFTLTVARIEYFVQIAWEQVRQPWIYNDDWDKVALD